MIVGVYKTKLKIKNSIKGSILKVMSNDSKAYKSFGEVYLSTINPGVVKGWNMHKKMTVNLACITGKIKLVLYDERKNSKTFNKYSEFILSRKNYFLLTIPPNVWFAFQNILNKKESLLINFASIKHKSRERLKRSIDNNFINYKW